MALKGLFLLSLLTVVIIDYNLADVNTSVKPNGDLKRRNDVVDVAFLEQKDVLLDMLESKLKEVRDKKKKKSDRSDFNQETANCDSQPGNVDLKIRSKGISAVGDSEVSLKLGKNGKATLNLDANGISNVGRARLELGVDDGGLYVPGLCNLFVGNPIPNLCSNLKDGEREQNATINYRRSGSDVANKSISNDLDNPVGGSSTPTEIVVNQTVVDNASTLATNNTVTTLEVHQVNNTVTVTPVTVAQNDTSTKTV